MADSVAPTPLQLEVLRVVNAREGIYPADLAWTLAASGAITTRHPGRRMTAQGAGFIGGKLLGQTYRAGWTTYCVGGGVAITAAGRRVLQETENG